MNRTFVAALVAAVLLEFTPAQAQVALVVGSVRDEAGTPIEGARVSGLVAGGTVVASTATDVAGTFALPGDRIVAVSIACRFCRTQTAAIAPGRPVVAIVRRYDALTGDAPTPQDLANLPYARVESSLALRPFTLLRQTTGVLPGSQLSDFGLLPTGALVIDDGVPNYDFSLGLSPYDVVPARFESSVAIAPPSGAFLYGDRAGSGTVSLDPFGGDAVTGEGGGDAILRLEAQSPATDVVAATYSNDAESRQRADGRWTIPISPEQTLQFGGGAAQDRAYGDVSSTLAENYAFARAGYDDAEPSLDVHAAFETDRGAYVATLADIPLADFWSDAQYSAGIRGRGAIAPFADVSSRLSTGIYDATAYDAPRIAGTLVQDRFDAGVQATGTGYAVTAGIGAFHLGYTGGAGGASQPSDGNLATPSLRLQLFPNGKFGADLSASGSFAMPSLWDQYEPFDNDGAFVYDRSSLYAATFSYTDDARLRISVEGATQRVRGYTNGLVTSTGASLAWQVAPTIALRAWTMYVDDATIPGPNGSFYGSGYPANAGALWLTYQNATALRLDVIYRRDLLDRQPFEHVDAAISGPLLRGLRWYAGVEDRQRTTYLDVGLRF